MESDRCCLQAGGVLPLIDFAYQGFANGIAEDAAALIPFLEQGNEFLVCSSFSKNFGLYAERVGALTVVAENREAADIALSHAKKVVRTNYSNPPKARLSPPYWDRKS